MAVVAAAVGETAGSEDNPDDEFRSREVLHIEVKYKYFPRVIQGVRPVYTVLKSMFVTWWSMDL